MSYLTLNTKSHFTWVHSAEIQTICTGNAMQNFFKGSGEKKRLGTKSREKRKHGKKEKKVNYVSNTHTHT